MKKIEIIKITVFAILGMALVISGTTALCKYLPVLSKYVSLIVTISLLLLFSIASLRAIGTSITEKHGKIWKGCIKFILVASSPFKKIVAFFGWYSIGIIGMIFCFILTLEHYLKIDTVCASLSFVFICAYVSMLTMNKETEKTAV